MHFSHALILAIIPLALAAPFLETRDAPPTTASGTPAVDEEGDPIPPALPTEKQITDLVTAAVAAAQAAAPGGGGGLAGPLGAIGKIGQIIGGLTKGAKVGKRDAEPNHAPGHHHHGTGEILPREAKGGKGGGGHHGHHGGVSINWARDAEAEAEANHKPGHGKVGTTSTWVKRDAKGGKPHHHGVTINWARAEATHLPGHHHHPAGENSKAGHPEAGHGKAHIERDQDEGEKEKRQDPLAGALGGLSGLGNLGGGNTEGSNNGGAPGGAAGGLLGKIPVVGPVAGSVVGSTLGGIVNGLNLPVVSGLDGPGLGGLGKREDEE